MLDWYLTPARTPVGGNGSGAATAITATLAAAVGKTTWIQGFLVTGLGATAAAVIDITVTGLLGGTRTFSLAVPAGATVPVAEPLLITFDQPFPASAVNTAIVVNVPSFGAGNTAARASAWGFQA